MLKENVILRIIAYGDCSHVIICSRDYLYMYRVIARLQYLYGYGDYKNDVLTAKQIAFVLSEALGLETLNVDDVISYMNKNNLDMYDVVLHENWEDCVMKFCFDNDSINKNEIPYFYPEVKFSDYDLDSVEKHLLASENNI